VCVCACACMYVCVCAPVSKALSLVEVTQCAHQKRDTYGAEVLRHTKETYKERPIKETNTQTKETLKETYTHTQETDEINICASNVSTG